MTTLCALLALVAAISLAAGIVGITFSDTASDWPTKAIGVFLVSAILALVCAIPVMVNDEDRLLAACMKDHKEYECVSMLRRHEDNTVVMPVIVSGR